jgi:hypothetical protein
MQPTQNDESIQAPSTSESGVTIRQKHGLSPLKPESTLIVGVFQGCSLGEGGLIGCFVLFEVRGLIVRPRFWVFDPIWRR